MAESWSNDGVGAGGLFSPLAGEKESGWPPPETFGNKHAKSCILDLYLSKIVT